jgi:hypothetical protein
MSLPTSLLPEALGPSMAIVFGRLEAGSASRSMVSLRHVSVYDYNYRQRCLGGARKREPWRERRGYSLFAILRQ